MSSIVRPASSRRRTASAIAPRSLAERHADHTVVRRGRLAGDRSEHGDGLLATMAVAEMDLEAIATTCAFSVRRPLRNDEPLVDDRDPVREPVGLVEVLRREKNRRPACDECLHRVPEPDVAANVEPGRGLVEKRTGGRATSAAARSRRRRILRVGADEPAAGLREVEVGQELVGPRPLAARRPRWYRRPTISRFSQPVRFSSTAAYWPASPMLSRTLAGSRVTSKPATMADPASAERSVVRIRTAVVFPAPLGPAARRHFSLRPRGRLRGAPRPCRSSCGGPESRLRRRRQPRVSTYLLAGASR